MLEIYINLLKEHVIYALTNTDSKNLKQYTEQLVLENAIAREDILKAYRHVNKELIGTPEV